MLQPRCTNSSTTTCILLYHTILCHVHWSMPSLAFFIVANGYGSTIAMWVTFLLCILTNNVVALKAYAISMRWYVHFVAMSSAETKWMYPLIEMVILSVLIVICVTRHVTLVVILYDTQFELNYHLEHYASLAIS